MVSLVLETINIPSLVSILIPDRGIGSTSRGKHAHAVTARNALPLASSSSAVARSRSPPPSLRPNCTLTPTSRRRCGIDWTNATLFRRLYCLPAVHKRNETTPCYATFDPARRNETKEVIFYQLFRMHRFFSPLFSIFIVILSAIRTMKFLPCN